MRFFRPRLRPRPAEIGNGLRRVNGRDAKGGTEHDRRDRDVPVFLNGYTMWLEQDFMFRIWHQ